MSKMDVSEAVFEVHQISRECDQFRPDERRKDEIWWEISLVCSGCMHESKRESSSLVRYGIVLDTSSASDQ